MKELTIEFIKEKWEDFLEFCYKEGVKNEYIKLLREVEIFHNDYINSRIMVIVPEMIKIVDKNYRIFVYIFIAIFLIAYLIMIKPKYSFFFM